YALVAVLGISILWSGPQVGLDKFLRFVGFNLLGFLLASLTPARRRRWLMYGFIPVGAAGIASVGLALTQMQAVGRLTAFGGNPIWTARLLCVAGLVMLWWPGLSYWIKVPTAAAFFAVAVFTGSRGPLLNGGLVIVLALLGRAVYSRRRGAAGQWLILFLVLVLVVGAGFLALRAIASEQAAVNPYSPFVRIFADTPETEASTETRLVLYQIALEQFGQHPFLGIGLGGMANVLQSAGVVYPHNLFLEFASETGIIGLLLHASGLGMAFFGAVPYLRSSESRTRENTAVGLMLFLFALLNAQVSGDMVGNKMLWFSMGYLNGLISEGGWGVPGLLRRRKVLLRKGE
ncbi:MAG: O-antigen ligase family protein, partial [Anaerolineae bacterium]